MRKRLLSYTVMPRWVIQIIDLTIVASCFAFSFLFVKRFEFFEIYRGHFFVLTGFYCIGCFMVFYSMRIHTGLIRYSNIVDVVRIFLAVLISSFVYLLVINLVVPRFFTFNLPESSSVLLINFFISSSLLIFLRAGVKQVFFIARKGVHSNQEPIVIYGIDHNSLLLKNALEAEENNLFKIIGFVHLRAKMNNAYIEQKKVFGLNELDHIKQKYNVQKLILLSEKLSEKERELIVTACLKHGIKLVTVPPANQWANGKLSITQLKELNIEDLLQREPIVINNTCIRNEIAGKRVLVTGAAGSIGAELVRQILRYAPETIILCDQAESSMHEIQLETEQHYPDIEKIFFIGSIQNFPRMKFLFDKFRPHVVFHAAAYKHVPMMELNPSEAVCANVLGTKNIAELDLVYNADKFVMVSTDKAVNPTNVMGASKRIAELYIQSLNDARPQFFELQKIGKKYQNNSIKGKTKFVTTRFGNVLGSNGSVLPRFQAQIQKGGPVTVTHPEITRYFMTIPEAVQLVLEAATMGTGGEIFLFDMGKPVKIVNLATQMIMLAGLEPNKDISIQFTGLRPGEKLYEELLIDQEMAAPTHHEKIKIAKVIANNYEKVLFNVEELLMISSHNDDELIVQKMKEIVPEFISSNSRFESLDHKNATGAFQLQKTERY